MANDEKYQLSNLDIQTVGIVSRGAVSLDDDEEPGVNFFLMKEADMSDKETVIVEEAVTTKGLLEKLESLPAAIVSALRVQKADGEDDVSKPDPAAILEAAETLQQGGYKISAEQLGQILMPDAVTEEPDDEQEYPALPEGEEAGEEEEEMVMQSYGETLKALTEAQLAQIEKRNQAQLETLQKSLEMRYSGTIKDLQERVTKAEAETESARIAKRKQELIQEAGNYWALPTDASRLGDLLFKANEALDEETYAEFEALLKAADNQLGAAGVFGEFGTAAVSEEQASAEVKIDKAVGAGQSVEAALLNLDPAEQVRLLKERNRRVTGKGGK